MPAMSKQIGLSREGSSRSGGGDPGLDPGPFSTKPARRRPRVLFVGTAFYGLSQTYPPLAPAPVYLDWQHRNLKMLESFPIELIHKPHPGGLFVGRPPGMDHLARIDPRQVVHARRTAHEQTARMRLVNQLDGERLEHLEVSVLPVEIDRRRCEGRIGLGEPVKRRADEQHARSPSRRLGRKRTGVEPRVASAAAGASFPAQADLL